MVFMDYKKIGKFPYRTRFELFQPGAYDGLEGNFYVSFTEGGVEDSKIVGARTRIKPSPRAENRGARKNSQAQSDRSKRPVDF